MSDKELSRLEVMQRLQCKKLSQASAASILEISTRQVKRLFSYYKSYGAAGLVSKKS